MHRGKVEAKRVAESNLKPAVLRDRAGNPKLVSGKHFTPRANDDVVNHFQIMLVCVGCGRNDAGATDFSLPEELKHDLFTHHERCCKVLFECSV
jgi:hypothetical protein